MFKQLGKFEIQKVLGRGAMGEVYLGTDPAIGREVAIKTILDASAQGGEAKERFAREAKAAGVLNHPNLVTIYEFGEDQGVLYIAMEFVRGHDFEELLRDQALTRSELLEVLAQVCDGLDFAHRAGIVHRDIKPTNVRVQKDGRRLHAKVMDFGVARVGNSDMTATGIVMGTVSYMAPEYIRTGKPDPRSDLFAVGVMLYEALAGRKPFSGDTTPTILYKIVNEAPDPIDTTELQGISPAIKAVLDRALCKDPDQRFQHADEFARALRAAKDPTWSGQMDDGTVRVAARGTAAGAPPAPSAPTAAMAPATVQLNAPTAPAMPAMAAPAPGAPATAGGSKKGLWIGLAALLLAGLGVGGYLALKPKEVQAAANAPAPQDPAADPSTAKDPAKGGRPAAGAAKQDARGAVSLTTPQDAKGAVTEPQQKPVVDAKPAEKKPSGPEPRAIDQPQKYEPQNLEKLEVHERMNLGNVSMSEAIQLVEKDPEKAIYGFKQAIKADPGNANAYAWLATVYYEKGRYGEFAQVLRDARRAGVTAQMGRNARFMAAYRQAKFNHRLPSDLGE